MTERRNEEQEDVLMLVCINNQDAPYLTVGRAYEARRAPSLASLEMVSLDDDRGHRVVFRRDRFSGPSLADSVKESNPKDSVGIRKAPLSCVPSPVLLELGVPMQEGAHKYGRHNYRAIGVRTSVYYDATMRHMMSWWEGEDIDPDSGVSHVTKAIASLVVLRDAMIQGKVHDDRPPRSAPFMAELNDRTAALADKFQGKSLPPYIQSAP